MDIKILEELGLTDGEIKVYLALLRLGETTSGPLVKESEVSVSKVYPIIDRLSKKGLASYIIKENTRYFKAADPKILLNYIKEKEEKLKANESKLKEILPELMMMNNSARLLETAQIYDGLKGIQTARERTLSIMKKGDEMWIIGIANSPYEGMMDKFFREYHKRRYDKGIKCKFLYNEESKEHGEISKKYPLSEVKYMKKGLVTNSWIEIYADTVTIGINKGKSFSIVIQNQEVADSFRVYAEMLWSLGKNNI